MDAFVKGFLQGSIPTIVLVGGTHYLVKGFKVSRPVVYWGSLAVAAGLTYAVVQGKIKAPFMNAETFGAESNKAYVVTSDIYSEAIVANNEQSIKNSLKPYYSNYLEYYEDYESEEKSWKAWDKMSLEEAGEICNFNLDVMDLSKGIRIFRDGQGLDVMRE